MEHPQDQGANFDLIGQRRDAEIDALAGITGSWPGGSAKQSRAASRQAAPRDTPCVQENKSWLEIPCRRACGPCIIAHALFNASLTVSSDPFPLNPVSFLDALFGSIHLPRAQAPTTYGLDRPMPQRYAPQLLYPFIGDRIFQVESDRVTASDEQQTQQGL
jgi:hypothetical protein